MSSTRRLLAAALVMVGAGVVFLVSPRIEELTLFGRTVPTATAALATYVAALLFGVLEHARADGDGRAAGTLTVGTGAVVLVVALAAGSDLLLAMGGLAFLAGIGLLVAGGRSGAGAVGS